MRENWALSIPHDKDPQSSKLPSNQPISWKEFQVRWIVFIPFLIIHIGALSAFYYFSWSDFIISIALANLTGVPGICVLYHRMIAHRTFEMARWMKWVHLLLASMNFQQGPISWARIHRAHHTFSDTDKDPHPQHRGALFGHVGWTFMRHPVIGRSKEVKEIPSDLAQDKDLVFFEKYNLLIAASAHVILFLTLGLKALLWFGFFRTFYALHCTLFVNSITHRFGYRTYKTTDRSRNNWIVSVLTLGEGWHNNHHRFPASARSGLKPFEIDLSWHWISLMGKLRIARKIRAITAEVK